MRHAGQLGTLETEQLQTEVFWATQEIQQNTFAINALQVLIITTVPIIATTIPHPWGPQIVAQDQVYYTLQSYIFTDRTPNSAIISTYLI